MRRLLETCFESNRLGTPGVLAVALLLMLLAVPPAAVASDVVPTVIPGNPSCTDLGYDFGFKPQPEPPPSGTYTFPDGVNELTLVSDGTYFDWTSTLGLDAVIAKGGPNANVYSYSPEAFADTGLSSPINPNNGQPFAISHIEVCYDYEVVVSKDAHTSFTRTYTWTIDKSVTPDEWLLFAGGGATSTYTVAVDRIETDSDWAVEGTITIYNPSPFTAVITSITDVISPDISAAVTCDPAPGTMGWALAPFGTLTCTYQAALPDGNNRDNTATVTTEGTVGGGEATALVDFGAATIDEVGFPNVQVDDTNGSSWMASGDATWSYDRPFACPSDPSVYVGGTFTFDHPNTATIVETGQSDSASVTVRCFAPVVAKDAHTTFDRSWTWTLDKTADQTDLLLSPGQQFLVNYQVALDASAADSGWAVSGTISVANAHPTAAMTVALGDVLTGGIVAVLDCGGSLTVPAGGTATCGYSAGLPDGSPRVNTATATLNGIDFTGTAEVAFGAPTQEFDECVDVTDDLVGTLGTVCAADAPAVFSYSTLVGPYSDPEDCGEQLVVNIASFTAGDTGAMGSDTWTIRVNVACGEGCTLTPGYWKTHSRFGPAPYDDTWALLPAAEDTIFFLSGQTWYQVLWTVPQGNAYYILAHAYAAATLNVLNGASMPPEVVAAWLEAEDLFNQYTPDEIGALHGGKPPRPRFLELAGILDYYNNGILGPGHCSE